MKKLLWVLLVLVLGLGAYYYTRPPELVGLKAAREALRQKPSPDNFVLAAGSVVNNQTIAVASQVPGKILSMPEQAGQRVSAGEVLVKLDPADAENAYNQAEAALSAAEAHLQVLLEGATPSARQVAEAGVASAETALADAEKAYRQALATQAAEVAQAKTNLDNQKIITQRELYSPGGDVQKDEAEAQLQAAQTAYDTTVKETDAQVVQAENALKQAQAAKAQAEAQLAEVEAPPTPAQVAAARAEVSQAEAAAAEAKRNLGETDILSPVDGTVAQVLFRPGDRVVPDQPILMLAPSGDASLQVVVNVSASDIDRVRVGDAVDLTVPDLDLGKISGRVSYISPNGISQGGTVLYPVTVTVGPSSRLRSGLVVDARILVGS